MQSNVSVVVLTGRTIRVCAESNVSVVVLTGRTVRVCDDGLLFMPTNTSARQLMGSRDVF